MKTWEGDTIAPIVKSGTPVMFYARAIHSPDVGTGIQPYIPAGIAVSWQIPGARFNGTTSRTSNIERGYFGVTLAALPDVRSDGSSLRVAADELTWGSRGKGAR